MSPVADASPSLPAERAVLRWRVHRLRENPRGLVLVASGYILAVLLWRLALPYPPALMVILLSLTAALADFLFPVTYRLTEQGAHADGLVSRLFVAWADVKRATHGAEGVFLSPLPRASRLDSFRGLRLRYAGDNAPLVLDAVRRLRKGETL